MDFQKNLVPHEIINCHIRTVFSVSKKSYTECLIKPKLLPISDTRMAIPSNPKVWPSVTESDFRYVVTFLRMSPAKQKRIDKCLASSESYESSKFNLGPDAPRKDQNKSKSITNSRED